MPFFGKDHAQTKWETKGLIEEAILVSGDVAFQQGHNMASRGHGRLLQRLKR
jgi:hypothetical protein